MAHSYSCTPEVNKRDRRRIAATTSTADTS
jgi:hypothetical protein